MSKSSGARRKWCACFLVSGNGRSGAVRMFRPDAMCLYQP